MKTCFSEGKLMKQFGNPPPFLRETPFQLTPLFLSNFFMTPLFVQILNKRDPPNFTGGGLWIKYIVEIFIIFCYDYKHRPFSNKPLTKNQ